MLSNKFDDEFSQLMLNANNLPLFKSFSAYASYPQTLLWAYQVLTAAIVTGASVPAVYYINLTALSKHTPLNSFL